MNMSLPPDPERVRERHRLGVDAGQQIVGEDDLLAARLWAISRASSSSSTVAASEAALPSPPCASVHDPPSRRADRWIARRGIVSSGAPRGISCGYCRRVGSTETPQVFSTDVSDRVALVHHFHERGWVIIDAIEPATAAHVSGWVDEVAALADGERGVLQHFELTDSGPQLCRSENFVPIHAGFRALLCTGVLVELAGALLGEPAILYKEKVNYKLPGGAGYSPHQDAPAYPMIDVHVSAMVAVDDADGSNGGLEVVSGCFDRVLPLDERGCIDASVVEQLDWQPVPLRAGHTLWFHSRTPHRSGPNPSDQPRRALYPTYNAAGEGDLRAAYYEAKRAAFASAPTGDRARVSLIGDFEGRPA